MRDQSGVALVTVLMVIVVLLLLGTALIQLNTLEVSQVLKQEKRVQAQYLARSGLEVAVEYVNEQADKFEDIRELELAGPLEGTFMNLGSYVADLTKDEEKSTVQITSRGTVAGKSELTETIVLEVTLRVTPQSVDYASDIEWYVKKGDPGGQKLEPSTQGDPLVNGRPVVLEALNKVMAMESHHLRAPAMMFSHKTLEIKNKGELHLYSDFVVFNTEVSMSGILTFNVSDEPYVMDGKKYTIVYFRDKAFNQTNDPVEGITKGNYYLIKDGTKWDNGELTGEVIHVAQSSLPPVFDFSNIETHGHLNIVPTSFVYSAGN